MTLPLHQRQHAKFAIESELIAHGVDRTEPIAEGIIDGLERMGFILTMVGAPRKLTYAEKIELEKTILDRRKNGGKANG